jgi:hypothetical protein
VGGGPFLPNRCDRPHPLGLRTVQGFPAIRLLRQPGRPSRASGARGLQPPRPLTGSFLNLVAQGRADAIRLLAVVQVFGCVVELLGLTDVGLLLAEAAAATDSSPPRMSGTPLPVEVVGHAVARAGCPLALSDCPAQPEVVRMPSPASARTSERLTRRQCGTGIFPCGCWTLQREGQHGAPGEPECVQRPVDLCHARRS